MRLILRKREKIKAIKANPVLFKQLNTDLWELNEEYSEMTRVMDMVEFTLIFFLTKVTGRREVKGVRTHWGPRGTNGFHLNPHKARAISETT